jgi:hypothetical protein
MDARGTGRMPALLGVLVLTQVAPPTGKVSRRPSAGVMVAAALVAVGIVSRCIEPTTYGDFDETIYAQTLLLWLRGIPLYREIFYSQGPIFLMLLAPFALIPGPRLEAIQLGVTFWDSFGLVAVATLGYRLGGSWGAAVSAAVVSASPLLTHLDSHVLAEGPAVSLAALSLAIAWGSGLTFPRGVAAGALFGASLAVKALMPATAIPLLAKPRVSRLPQRRHALHVFALSLGGVLALALAFLPFASWPLVDQLVTYRVEARNAANAVPGAFTNIIVRGLRDDFGAVIAALVGMTMFLRGARGTAVILCVWLLGTVALLSMHQPLFARHSAALLLPLAVIASGVGLVTRPEQTSRARLAVPVLVIGIIIALSVPAQVRRWTDVEGFGDMAEAATAVRATVSPDEYVLTDIPAVALMADRLSVPGLVDLSGVRLNTGRLTPQSVAEQTEQYEPAAILFWLGRLDAGPMESYPATLTDRYSRVWQSRPGQSLWIREDAATFDPRGIPGIRVLGNATFENTISARAIGYSGQVRPSDVWRLRLLWELVDRPIDIDTVRLDLVSNNDSLIASTTLPASPEKAISHWPRGARRMVQYEIRIPADAPLRRSTPQLRLLAKDGHELALSASRQSVEGSVLELPAIQIVRG